jgi:hypothetical protein
MQWGILTIVWIFIRLQSDESDRKNIAPIRINKVHPTPPTSAGTNLNAKRAKQTCKLMEI